MRVLKAILHKAACFLAAKTVLKLAGLVLLVILLVYGVGALSALRVAASRIPDREQRTAPAAQGMIEPGSGLVQAADNGSKALFVDSGTLNLQVVDKATGRKWNAIRGDSSADDNSLLRINYIGEDGTSYTWDAYTYVTANQTYEINRIENGVRIKLDFKQAESVNINEYMPQRISIERYEFFFIEGLAAARDAGSITGELYDSYVSTLGIIYGRDDSKGIYYNKFSGTPSASVITQLIAVSKLVNYTREELLDDCRENDITIEFKEPVNFIITLEAVLDGDDLKITIPTDEIVNLNPYYTLGRVMVLPAFGAVNPQEAEGGFIFVPDGAGALMDLNAYNSNFGGYTRAVYDNDFFSHYFYQNAYPENLYMPVFGMSYGEEGPARGGYFGIIESGDETSFITATLASRDGSGGVMNRVYASFDAAQYSSVSILGPYESGGGSFISSTGMMDFVFTVRYKLYTGTVGYYDMAEDYRDYLIGRYGLTPSYQDKAGLYLDAVGAVSLDKLFLGVRRKYNVSMTSYEELREILSDLKDFPAAVNYLGVFNGGMRNTLMNRADPVRENGSAKQLGALLADAEQYGHEIFFSAPLSRVVDPGGGYNAERHAVSNHYGTYADFFNYNLATRIFTGFSDVYTVVNAPYLSGIVDGFIKRSDQFSSIYIPDLAHDFYASYKRKDIVTAYEYQRVIDENLEKLSNVKRLSLYNPSMNKIRFGDYAVDISRESSGYGGLSVSVPFRQLVMNGLIEYTTLNVNQSGVSEDYFLLQALELGSHLKYTITAKNVDILQYSNYSSYVSTEYQTLAEDIKSLCRRYSDAFESIGTTKIAGHRMLESNVFETTYANGVSVVVNYNKTPAELGDITLDGLGFLIR